MPWNWNFLLKHINFSYYFTIGEISFRTIGNNWMFWAFIPTIDAGWSFENHNITRALHLYLFVNVRKPVFVTHIFTRISIENVDNSWFSKQCVHAITQIMCHWKIDYRVNVKDQAKLNKWFFQCKLFVLKRV